MGNTSALSICAFCYIWSFVWLVVLQRSMINWMRGHSNICEISLKYWYSIDLLSIGVGDLLYVYAAICETSLVLQYSIHLGSIGGGTSVLSICALCYMLNIFGVVVFHRSIVNLRRGLGICAFCYVWNLFGVAVSHTSMVNWIGRYICPQYMCILLDVKHIWCSGIP